jgi:hypothetical protein
LAKRWLDQQRDRGRAVFPEVEELLRREPAVWELLDELDLGLVWPELASPTAQLRSELWAEAVRVLVGEAAAGFARELRRPRAATHG